MSGTRRRRVAHGLPGRHAWLQPEAGRARMVGRTAGGYRIVADARPSLGDLIQGLEMLEEVIVDGDAVARAVALCLLALLIDRFPTLDLQERAEDMLASFLADYPTGAELRATIGRLRTAPQRSLS